jgi:hypothetical protein
MKKKTLVIIAIVALLLLFLSKKRAFDSLDLKPAIPRNFTLIGLTQLEFDMPFTAFNGSDGTLNIGGIDLRVFAENQYIGRAFSPDNQKILPYGQSILTSRVIVSLIDLASALPGFLGGLQDQVVDLNMKGRLNVEGFFVNVDIPVRINIPQFKQK